MNPVQNKQTNISLNVIKCIAILAVIYVHCCNPNGTLNEMVVSLSRFAVPFFFLISGFYSYYASNDYALKKYRMRIIRLIKLVIISNLLFFFYNLLSSKIFTDAIPPLDLHSLICYFAFNLSPFVGHLWFLTALLYVYIIFYVLTKKNFDLTKLYYLIPILLIGNIILGEIFAVFGFSIPVCYYRNFLFMGLPFFIIGYLIHDKQEEVNNLVSDNLLVILIVAMVLLSMIEQMMLGIRCELCISSALLSISIMIWCVKNPLKLNLKTIAWIGGTLYTSMYVIHVLIFYLLMHYLHFGIFDPIIIFVFTILVSSIGAINK